MTIATFNLLKLFALVFSRLPLCISSTTNDTFDESLLLRPLPDGKLHARFSFSLQSPISTVPARLVSEELDSVGRPLSSNIRLRESGLIPPSFSELVDRFGVAELGLSLSRGRWDDTRWAEPSTIPSDRKPRGAQVWAWLDRTQKPITAVEESEDDERHKGSWSGLTNTLAGLFCASLGRLAEPAHVSRPPPELFPPRNPTQPATETKGELDLELFHGLLPLEQPCTENLTPVLRLLPCKGHAGLAMLANPHRLLEGNWQSIGVNLRRGKEIGNPGLELELVIEAVLDPVRRDRSSGGPGKRDWSLQSVFERSVSRACPIARSSRIIVVDDPIGVLEPRAESDGLPINGQHTFDLMRAVLPLDISMSWPSEPHIIYPSQYTPSLVSIERFWSGAGQAHGVLGVEVTNNAKEAVEAVYIEQLPWWITVYVHTLSTLVDEVERDDIVIKKVITPARARLRPLSLSLTLRLPAQSRTRLTFDYEKSLLLYTEYASDANRGFDLPPAALLLPSPSSGPPIRLWTSAALIYLATPDFSMPYNVIIVTSTLMALFFGSVFNLLVREFKYVKLPERKQLS
ncbi:hypothetical protein CROQUDRAFT_50207 [Cronartium quercuum f. sp. fusiforme G11]|uniref:GPI transamidase component PIG-T n=1 Tax=Cronartium quercuum f. sp. fusiforme G11 TaxID=708437 RepID=A0A9P6NE01_9BASI|nr:hypothetical protein CROQUDRAFT_50207 [Cronartium quercuum f. sp. fusiforme G11]